MAIRVRKKEKSFGDLSKEQKWDLLSLYIEQPLLTLDEMASKFNITSNSLKKFLQYFYTEFVQTKETKHLISAQNIESFNPLVHTVSFKHPSYINESFLSLLSPTENEVSEAEYTYAYVYVFTGNNNQALKESGLDVALSGRDGKQSNNKTQLSLLRGHYLRAIPRIKSLISELREVKLNDLGIDKPLVQSEVITLLEELKEEGNPATLNTRVKLIELLGKSIGVWQDNIKVEKIDSERALDLLVAKAREAETKSLPPSTPVDEVWEISGESGD